MVLLKAMVNIFGLMDPSIRETLNKDFETVMDVGKQRMGQKSIKGIIFLTGSMGTECISGQQDRFTREHI